ncbi:hypothetical protein [Streptomyces sp. B29(2018)]|uniref:hypothetical protein n=1 Tax=Streptomyces sp. B29(2018) TaxID=2485016 RepID=UPI000FD66CC0|nr:hypothetical protein [Streptomyces sp. B29(2018)]
MQIILPSDAIWSTTFFAVETAVLHPMQVYSRSYIDVLAAETLDRAHAAWGRISTTLPTAIHQHNPLEEGSLVEPYRLETALGRRLTPMWVVECDPADVGGLAIWHRQVINDLRLQEKLQLATGEPAERLLEIVGAVIRTLQLPPPPILGRELRHTLEPQHQHQTAAICLSAEAESAYRTHCRELGRALHPVDHQAREIYETYLLGF